MVERTARAQSASSWEESQLTTTNDSMHPMVLAVRTGNLPMCQWLLEHGAVISGQHYEIHDGATLMYLAACTGQLHVCEWLAQSGAHSDILTAQRDGKLPLYGALRRCNEMTARWFMEQGGAVELGDCSVMGPLFDSAIIEGKRISLAGFYLRQQRWAEHQAELEDGQFKGNLQYAAACMKNSSLWFSDEDTVEEHPASEISDPEEYWVRRIDQGGFEDIIPPTVMDSEAGDVPNEVKYYRHSTQGRACAPYRWQEHANPCHFRAFKAVRKRLSDELGVPLSRLA
eukprot:7387168-Prymnesium_polylepis.4